METMTMKHYKGDTDCRCVGGAQTGGGCGYPMFMLVPVQQACCQQSCGCGCDDYDDHHHHHHHGDYVRAITEGERPMTCGEAVRFDTNVLNSGTAITHTAGSDTFTVNQPGYYEVTYYAHLGVGSAIGGSATFGIEGHPETIATANTGTQYGDGTAYWSGTLYLTAGQTIRLVPIEGCNNTLGLAELSVKKVG
ncbi:MAG: hypothetical protein LBN97_01760 [Oscillospiraceae bacterium]|jgi:hypothetical protein|nr:hypothetical protein [Oscillospiraceae bacterium]